MKAANQQKVAAAQKVASAENSALATGQALSDADKMTRLDWNEKIGLAVWAMVPISFVYAMIQRFN